MGIIGVREKPVIRYRYLNFSFYIYKVILLRTCRPIGAPHDTNQHGTSVSFLIDARAFERAVRGSDYVCSNGFPKRREHRWSVNYRLVRASGNRAGCAKA